MSPFWCIICYLCSYSNGSPGAVDMKGNCFWADYGGKLDACSLQPIQVNLEKFTSILETISNIFQTITKNYNDENDEEDVDENDDENEFLNDVSEYTQFAEEGAAAIDTVIDTLLDGIVMFEEVSIASISQPHHQNIIESLSNLQQFENAVNNQFNQLIECIGVKIEIETINIENEEFNGLKYLMNTIGETGSIYEQMRLWDNLFNHCIESQIIASDISRNYTSQENIAFYLNKLPLISNYVALCYGISIEYIKTNKTLCIQNRENCNFRTLNEITQTTINILNTFETFINIAVYSVYRWFKGPRRYYNDYSSGSCDWSDESYADYLQCDELCKVTMIESKGVWIKWTEICSIKMLNKWTSFWDCFGLKSWTSTDFVGYTGCQFWRPCQPLIDQRLADNEPNALSLYHTMINKYSISVGTMKNLLLFQNSSNDILKYDKKLILLKQDNKCQGNITLSFIGNSFKSPQECYNKCIEKMGVNKTISCKYIIYDYDDILSPNCYGSNMCTTFVSAESDIFLSININSVQNSIVINNYTPNCNKQIAASSNPIIMNQQCINLYSISLYNNSIIADEFDSVIINNNFQNCSLYSYIKCNIRNIVNLPSNNWIESKGITTIIPSSVVLYANNSKCNEFSTYLGEFDSLSECAGQCFIKYGSDCKYFDYGYGVNNKKCHYESSCDKPITPKNRSHSISYNIYLLIEYLYTNKTYSGDKSYIGMKSTVSQCGLSCIMQQKIDNKPCKYFIFGRVSSINQYQKCYRIDTWSNLQNDDDYNLYQIPSTPLSNNVRALLSKINILIIIFNVFLCTL